MAVVEEPYARQGVIVEHLLVLRYLGSGKISFRSGPRLLIACAARLFISGPCVVGVTTVPKATCCVAYLTGLIIGL